MKKYSNKRMAQLKVVVLFSLFTICGCKKLVNVDPPVTSVTNESVFNDDANAISALTGLYSSMASDVSIYSSSLNLGLYADEFTLQNINGTPALYYKNKLAAGINSGAGFEFWNSFYPLIYRTNEAVSGISNSNKLSAKIKRQLMGEAKFMRAFYYFLLTNLYGDVPLILSTDYNSNKNMARATQSKVYEQIKTDLLDAQGLLSKDFLDGTLFSSSTGRLRPTYWAATALLARFYLYSGDWTNAEIQASILINNNALFGLSSLSNSFLRSDLGNNEAIWQLQTMDGRETIDGGFFILTGAPQNNQVVLSNALLNSFEPNDQRKLNWVGSVTVSGNTYYFPNKYKIKSGDNPSEYTMVFRLAEQYLIRAEARVHNNKLLGAGSAAEDINIIRARAGLGNTSAVIQSDLLNAVYHERQIELFSEQGHRWFDLKRTGLAITLMPGISATKGGAWSNNALLFPLPYSDILADPNLKQNPGY